VICFIGLSLHWLTFSISLLEMFLVCDAFLLLFSYSRSQLFHVENVHCPSFSYELQGCKNMAKKSNLLWSGYVDSGHNSLSRTK